MQAKKATKPAKKATTRASKKSANAVVIEDELIAHLPIRSDMLEQEITELVYDPKIPRLRGYNESTFPRTTITIPVPAPVNEQFTTEAVDDGTDNEDDAELEAAALAAVAQCERTAAIHEATVPAPNASIIDNMIVQFQNREGTIRVPTRTHLNCYWDGHSFTTVPCAIPIRENLQTKNYEVDHRVFCSPECAAAQLFADNIDATIKWTRFAFLNTIYSRMYSDKRTIRLAPVKDLLIVNGGTFTIDAYRLLCSEGRTRIDILLPPLVAINPSLDTKPSDYYDTVATNPLASIDGERAESMPTELRLKRSKPRANKDATLEKCMGLKKRD